MVGIYIITNRINGKKYIGLSVDIERRFKEHKSPKNIKNKNTNLYKAFRKYGVSNFSFEILELVDSIDLLSDKEVYWIDKIKPEYNMNEGGLGNKGLIISNETKEKIRIKAKENWNKMDEDKKNKIKKNFRRPLVGRSLSNETKLKLRLANIGKKMLEESKNKISEANKVKMIGNTNGNKSIIGTDSNGNTIEFESTKLAADFLKVHPSCITGVIKGRRKTCGGYSWKRK